MTSGEADSQLAALRKRLALTTWIAVVTIVVAVAALILTRQHPDEVRFGSLRVKQLYVGSASFVEPKCCSVTIDPRQLSFGELHDQALVRFSSSAVEMRETLPRIPPWELSLSASELHLSDATGRSVHLSAGNLTHSRYERAPSPSTTTAPSVGAGDGQPSGR